MGGKNSLCILNESLLHAENSATFFGLNKD